MVLSGRTILLLLAVIVVATGVVTWWVDEPVPRWLSLVAAAGGFGIIIVLNVFKPPIHHIGRHEPEDINELSPARQKELVRGTSLYLREMQYRYSIRPTGTDHTERRPFTAEVNTVHLGFLPTIIIDNTTDRQGHGYVAFVYDGKRWRGPGLPCPDGQAEAVRHAARCVSPLATEEETRL